MTHSTSQPTRASNVSRTLAQSRLGVPSVFFFAAAGAAPLTVVAGGATTGFAVTGTLGIPVSYFAIAIILAVFSVGYVAMSRHIVNAGAFYTYISHGLGKITGVGAAGVAVLGYNAMQVGLYGGFGAVLAGYLETRFGMSITWWECAFIGWALVAVLGVLRVDLNGKVLAVLLLAEIAIAVVYDAVMIGHPARGGVDYDTLAPSYLFASGIGAALVTAVTGFVGFEAGVVFSEETKDPKRTVARATYLALVVTGLLYGLSAWAMSVPTGHDGIVTAAQAQGTELIFSLVAPHVGQAMIDIGHILFITSLFAALLAFHNTVARYLFALGREGVLPAALGRTSRRSGAPKLGSLIQTALAFAVITVYAVNGWDPIVKLFFWLTVAGGLGVLILMVATSLAVLGYFRRNPVGENPWRRIIAPLSSFLALGAVLAITLDQFHLLLGVGPDSLLKWIFPIAYAVTAASSAAWALALRLGRPSTYAAIGLGANSPTPATAHA
ncbi:amino acid permease [Catellatospora sp. TT07R-123]|uniref:APC family permease n=1 Tax=Catellatospora sp. TT07R-123 TaxID=2733863 RepID=UPI001B191E90|nr:APC family permease [Catellatospora sp. TT07R-123]GHJ45905.1 amino acid permease [Catellatospora sp. TT07R-123]